MYSLLTVNNHVSLININVAPSTFLITIIILCTFTTIYLFGSSFLTIPRLGISTLSRAVSPLWKNINLAPTPTEKPLPALPFGNNSQLVLEDQQLVIAGKDIVLARDRHRQDFADIRGICYTQETTQDTQQAIVQHRHHERSPRSPRRLTAGLRTPRKSNPSPLSSPQRSRDDGGRPGRLGDRFRRWVLTSSMEKTRKRRSEQRLLERP